METLERFEQLAAWQRAHNWVIEVNKLTRCFAEEERSGLTAQLRRAAASVPSNIVEGFNRVGIKDKLRFYVTARASLEEARYFLILAQDHGLADAMRLRLMQRRLAESFMG